MCFIMVDLSLFFAIISAAALIRVESYQFGFFLLWPRVPILSLLCGHGVQKCYGTLLSSLWYLHIPGFRAQNILISIRGEIEIR